MNIFPLPEALDGNHWTVEPGTGSCDTVGRTLLVPVGETSGDRFVRNHEMAHAKITPRHSASKLAEKYGLSMDAMQVCEDLRVHRFLSHSGVDCSGVLSQQEMDLYLAKCHSDVRKIGLLLMASLCTDDYPRALSSMLPRIGENSLNQILDRVQLVDRRLRSARNLFRRIGFRNGTAPAAKLFDALFPAGEELGSLSKDAPEGLPLRELMICKPPSGTKTPVWGTLSIKTLPSTLMRQVPAIARQKTYRDEGACLAAVHRLPVDGRIFSRFKPQIGGTVLIDGSGSMSLSRHDLEKIVTTAPASTVAIYNGRGTSGTLTIIARSARYADTDGLSKARIGNGNIVDGPALEWLGKQAEPRIWVSDGWVTGKHDQTSVDLAAEAQALCNKFGIRRVAKPEAVFGFLAAFVGAENKTHS